MDQDLKDALNVIVGMLDTLGKKIDKLDQTMERIGTGKTSSMYGEYEIFKS
ncbi:hypothetical protein [Inediibacterium massiliense]|uniref:hypothetical protein n=1 Tax=Inediibacterium massiliense TaxID=1658111 RepID=UPI0018FEBE2C|nr:hypothetical protein [Inediibacterium massiliense]